jgi:hypothetical protein
MKRFRLLWIVAITALSSAVEVPGEEVRLLPEAARLQGPPSAQRFLVERWNGTTWVGDETGRAEFSVDNSRVATVGSDGVVVPRGNGFAILLAKLGDRVAQATISVEDFDQVPRWSFRNHVEPVLTKQGCNSGACHGAAAGKNGLRLSLRGYAPEQDYDVLTRQASGRRIVMTAPAESLLLLKPSGALSHGGGVKFAPGSIDYRVLAEWIAAGMPPPREDEPVIRSLRVYPDRVRLEPHQSQQVIVQAVYSDGRVDDVTPWVKFGSTDETVTRVDEMGRVSVSGRGEAAITIWFASMVNRLTVTSPFDARIDGHLFASVPRLNPIDEKNLAKLESLGIPPSPDAGDAAFIRRASLDATGTLPAATEAHTFIKDQDPSKRTKLVERLLDSREFVDFWTYKWSDLLLVSSGKLTPQAMWSFHRFIRRSVEENQPWDRFARALITAKGSGLSNGAVNFFALHRDPIELAENTSMAFLGLSLTCARCHNHPMEKWTQDQYYGFANLFSRVRLKDGDAPGEVIVMAAPDGEILHPRKGVAMAPQPLDAEAISLDHQGDRRQVLADWITRPDNPYFAKAIVNRVWANFFGRGLIHPEDDLRVTNPPSDEDLMSWLVVDFIAHGYDIKHLIRTIMNSATYARSSVPVPGNETDTRYLSHYPVKRLSAEVLLDAVSQVTEAPTSFASYPPGWRSLQLPDNKVENAFLDGFGRPARVSTCSCERSSEPSMSQALHLANGATVNEKLRSDSGIVAREVAGAKNDDEVLDRLFLAALSRQPTTTERNRIGTLLKEAAKSSPDPKAQLITRRQALEDVYWAVLTCNEFLFNH